MSRRRKAFDESLDINNLTYMQYLNRLTELSISMFEWKNLPETMDSRFLEMTLFRDGKAVFFEDDVIGDVCLQCATQGKFDIYRVPEQRRAYSANGYQKSLDNKNSVIVYNNMIRTNSLLDVRMFATRLYNLDRIIDINANAQKTPVLIQCSEGERLTLENLYKEFDGNAPVIKADKNLDLNSLKVLKTDAPYIADKLYSLKAQYWNEALTYLGISNVSFQKKERLISDEVSRSMGSTLASRYSRLNARRQGAEMYNAMRGTNIQVDYREDYRELEDVRSDVNEGDNSNE